MFTVRQILLFMTVFVIGLQTQAQELQPMDLGDILSPEEIAEEFGFEQQQNLRRNMLWNSSALDPRLHIIINKANKGTATDAQTLEAYLDGTLVYKFKVSTGAETRVQTTSGKWSNRRTSTGIFRIYLRSRNHVSKTWVGASMPFAQFFNGGIAMHATTPNHYHELGRRASGGCVRLHPTNAKLIWELVGKIGVEETLVTVYDGTFQAHPHGMAGGNPLITEKDINNALGSQVTPTTPATPTPVPAPVPVPAPKIEQPQYPAWGGKTPEQLEEEREEAEEQAEKEREAVREANKEQLRRIQKQNKYRQNNI